MDSSTVRMWDWGEVDTRGGQSEYRGCGTGVVGTLANDPLAPTFQEKWTPHAAARSGGPVEPDRKPDEPAKPALALRGPAAASSREGQSKLSDGKASLVFSLNGRQRRPFFTWSQFVPNMGPDPMKTYPRAPSTSSEGSYLRSLDLSWCPYKFDMFGRFGTRPIERKDMFHSLCPHLEPWEMPLIPASASGEMISHASDGPWLQEHILGCCTLNHVQASSFSINLMPSFALHDKLCEF